MLLAHSLEPFVVEEVDVRVGAVEGNDDNMLVFLHQRIELGLDTTLWATGDEDLDAPVGTRANGGSKQDHGSDDFGLPIEVRALVKAVDYHSQGG